MNPELYDFPFAQFKVYPHYIVGEPVFGANMGLEETHIAREQLVPLFEGRPWGYIGNRVNLNSVDPMVYASLKEKASNFTAMAIVAYAPSTARVAALEEALIRAAKVEFGLFGDLASAEQWMLEILGVS